MADFAIINNELYYLGEDELSKQAAKEQKIHVMSEDDDKSKYLDEVEDLAVSSIVSNSNNEMEVGEKLYTKNSDNMARWNVVTEVEDNELKRTYGTGWTYVPAGTTIEGIGLLKNAYMIDFTNKEAVQFNKDIHVKMSVADTVVAKDNLIFNADPSVMEAYNNSVKNGTEFDISELGENIRFYGYNNDTGKSDNWENPDLSKAFTASSFEFDGINDYIRIEYDNDEQKQILAENGFTFEFYGILNDGTSYDPTNLAYNNNYKGLFCYWDGDESAQGRIRFGVHAYGNNIVWNASYNQSASDFSAQGASSIWNQYYSFEDSLYGKEIYLTVVLDTSDEYIKDDETYYKQTFYVNGEKTKYDGGYNQKQWNAFIQTLDSLKYFCFGRSSYNGNGYWHYIKMSCYSLKFYNKGLSQDDVEASYKKTVAYHDFLTGNPN